MWNLVVALLIILGAGFGGYTVMHNNPGMLQKLQKKEIPVDWVETKSTACLYSIKYPPDWEATLNEVSPNYCILSLKKAENKLNFIVSGEHTVYSSNANNPESMKQLQQYPKVAVAGYSGYLLPASSTSGKSLKAIAFDVKGIGYQFTYTDQSPDQELIKDIYNSLELLPTPTSQY